MFFKRDTNKYMESIGGVGGGGGAKGGHDPP